MIYIKEYNQYKDVITELSEDQYNNFEQSYTPFTKKDINLFNKFNITSGTFITFFNGESYFKNSTILSNNLYEDGYYKNFCTFSFHTPSSIKLDVKLDDAILIRKYTDDYYIIEFYYKNKKWDYSCDNFTTVHTFKIYLIDQLESLEYFLKNMNSYL